MLHPGDWGNREKYKYIRTARRRWLKKTTVPSGSGHDAVLSTPTRADNNSVVVFKKQEEVVNEECENEEPQLSSSSQKTNFDGVEIQNGKGASRTSKKRNWSLFVNWSWHVSDGSRFLQVNFRSISRDLVAHIRYFPHS